MKFTTADLLDAHADLESCDTQFKSFGRSPCFHGVIRTVRCRNDNALIRQVLSERCANAVLVVDGDASLHYALIGDVLTNLAMNNGWIGAIVNGAVRDTAAMSTLDFGVKALGTNPRRSGKAGSGEIDSVVHFGGATFTPGHHLYSDHDGIVVSAHSLFV